MSNKWKVHTFGGPDNESFEISIVREDFEHGFKSYGWFEEGKKHLISHNGGPCRWSVSNSVWKGLLLVAKHEADTLNNLEELLSKDILNG